MAITVSVIQENDRTLMKFNIEKGGRMVGERYIIVFIMLICHILCTSSYLNYRTLPPFSYVLGVKCGVHLCCNTCCDYIQLISVELPILGNYARNGQTYCNLIPRIPGI